MKHLFTCLPSLEKQCLEAKKIFLMMDYDGTLAALRGKPQAAFLSQSLRVLLKKISKFIPVAIISGRSLRDIKRKIEVRKLTVVGNHGLEWEINGQHKQAIIPIDMIKTLKQAKRNLLALQGDFPGSFLEDKILTLAFHYRLVNTRLINKLLQEALKRLNTFQQQKLLEVRQGKKILDIRPALDWNKGKAVQVLLGRKKTLPVYVGDDATDEDAFKAIPNGITVRVGKNKQSAARYYVRNEREVASFVRWLITIVEKYGNVYPL